jgi:ankyrin repeat protein
LNFIFLLFKASESGHLEVVRLLINNERCNINEKDNDGRTALQWGEYLNI